MSLIERGRGVNAGDSGEILSLDLLKFSLIETIEFYTSLLESCNLENFSFNF